METKINIAEILKDSPKGTKLYSPIFGDVYLKKIRPYLAIIVTINKGQGDFNEEFLYDGRYRMNGECMLFPSKENRDWSKFKRPFKDGDIVATNNGSWIGLTTGGECGRFMPTYCVIKNYGKFEAYLDRKESWQFHRLATEEEKQKLFDAIKANGYKWNAETKTLEKLVEPKFKVGDRIIHKDSGVYCNLGEYAEGLKVYHTSIGISIKPKDLEQWELAPNKFDITTLKPFKSEVLVRNSDIESWCPAIFGCKRSTFTLHKYVTMTEKYYTQCIPYKGNKHLLGTTEDCNEFYKTWK